MKNRKGLRCTNSSYKNSHRIVKYSMENIVKNTEITMCGVRQIWEQKKSHTLTLTSSGEARMVGLTSPETEGATRVV